MLALLLIAVLAPADAATVTIKDVKYAPAELTVAAGQTVTWKNADDRDHRVVAADGKWRSDNLPPSATFTHTFKEPGSYTYGSAYYPRMKGVIVVKE